jgi:methenyltetrahydrofolate cyclohydrolase
MRDQTIEHYLRALADRVSTPGGGAAAALHAAQAAALIAMVARYSDGPRYDAALMDRVIAAADALRERSLSLAAADAEAFDAVMAAYKVPKTDLARPELVASALAGATRPPQAVIDVAEQLVSLAEELLPAGNRNLIADVAAAASAATAAAVTARVNIEVNLRREADTSALVDDIVARADQVVAAVRAEIVR